MIFSCPLFFIAFTSSLILIDLVSKYIFEYLLTPYYHKTIIPFFLDFSYVRNYGISFGLSFPLLSIIIPLFGLACIYCIYRFFQYSPSFIRGLGSSLFIAGALGNMIDRVYHGYVIDFISVYYHQWKFPVFNVADIFISIGGILLWVSTLSYFKKDQ